MLFPCLHPLRLADCEDMDTYKHLGSAKTQLQWKHKTSIAFMWCHNQSASKMRFRCMVNKEFAAVRVRHQTTPSAMIRLTNTRYQFKVTLLYVAIQKWKQSCSLVTKANFYFYAYFNKWKIVFWTCQATRLVHLSDLVNIELISLVT